MISTLQGLNRICVTLTGFSHPADDLPGVCTYGNEIPVKLSVT